MPCVPRSGLRRSVFAVDGREEEEQRRKRHRESGDRLRRTAGLHLPIQSKGAKCDSRHPKIFRLALRSTRQSTHKPLTFNIKGAHFSKSQKTQNHIFYSHTQYFNDKRLWRQWWKQSFRSSTNSFYTKQFTYNNHDAVNTARTDTGSNPFQFPSSGS